MNNMNLANIATVHKIPPTTISNGAW